MNADLFPLEDAIATLSETADPVKAIEMRKYHKTQRPVLGISNPTIDAAATAWRQEFDLDQRLHLAIQLWDSGIFEARIAAAKLLAQARIRPDDTAAWELIKTWVPQFCGWAIADHVCGAGAKRLVWDPSRLDEVEVWTTSDHLWTKRAALVMTLPWTKQNNPKPAEIQARERILGWAADYTTDHRWFIQKSIGWWLRDLSRHDPDRTKSFVQEHGDKMKPFAVKEALRKLPK
ncbi:DNA alkylation repair protein [Algirhabdus cladophorae]|uniref:DNA alkylation repair protein n=1 Tax=Algirhabdus cladophorae TaxID=3377108 RepID=UPI003B848271